MQALTTFRYVALAEGISYLLFAVTMPLKYGYGMGLPNRIVGLAHGVLFIAYGILALYCAYKLKWKVGFTFMVLLASLVPFATFYLEAKYLKKMKVG